MICVYEANCSDFSGNGLGVLTPSDCSVTETLNGEWELTLTHPLDKLGKWQRLTEGRILTAPVPASSTPRVNLITQSAGTDIYKVSTQSGTLRLRSGPGTSYKILKSYKKNTEVILIQKTSSSWYEVTCPDGKRGYMSTEYLTYVRTEGNVPAATGEVIEPRQLRDQPFRIYRVVPELTKVTVYARHIFYDLLDNMLQKVEPSSSTVGAAVVRAIADGCLSSHDFTFYSDLDSTAEEVLYENINPIEALLGDEGVTGKYKGELARDWWDVFVVKRVGKDTAVGIRERKNLTGITYDLDMTNVVTRIMPTGQDKDGEVLYLPELYIDSPIIDLYTQPKWIHLDVSEAKEVTEGDDKKTKAQCYTEMRAAAQKEFDNGCDLPDVTLKVDFVSCENTVEYAQYAHLQNIYLGDSVQVVAPRIGVAVAMRMTQYTYDCLLKRYTAVTLGTVTDTLEGSMITGRQLASGSITGSKIAMNAIGTGQLQSGSVGSLQIKLAAVETAHIQDAAITNAKIGQAAIGSANIQQAAIENAHLGNAVVHTANIQDLAVTKAKVAEAAIGTAQIEDAAITSAHIGEGQIQTAHIAEAAIQSAQIDDAAILAAHIKDGEIDTAKIKNAAITNAKIAGAAIGTANIQDAAIVTAKIQSGAITRAKIADLAVGTAQIDDLAVTTAKIAQAAITNAQIANATIGTAKIALGAITAALIANGAVGTIQIADGSITDAKIVELTANKITAGQLSVERLIIRGSDQSIIYAINNMGTLVSTQVNTIDGYVLTERTITADKIVAHAITANEIASKTITANEILAGTITGSEIAANAIDAGHIKAGAITTSKVSSDFGDTLDLSGNQGVTIRVENAVHDAISGMELGGRNYVLSADVENASSEYNIHQYKLSTPMTAGEKYTLTVCCTPAAGVASIRPYVSGSYYCLCILDVTETGRQILKKTFTAGYYTGRTPEDDETNADVAFFRFPNDGTVTGESVIHWVQIEKGDAATDFSLAPEDEEEALQTRLADIHSQISTTSDEIRQEVQATYATSYDMAQAQQQLATLAEQTENNFTWSVSKINEIIEDARSRGEATDAQLEMLRTYMTFSEDGLTIGKTGNPFTFRVVNDRLAFFMNNTEVAYLSNNKLYVTQAEILTRLQIGKFTFEPQANGNLSLIYTG